MPGPKKSYEYFIVVLTKQGKLIDAYVKANSIAEAMDKMIDQLELAKSIQDFKFCVRQETVTKESNEL